MTAADMAVGSDPWTWPWRSWRGSDPWTCRGAVARSATAPDEARLTRTGVPSTSSLPRGARRRGSRGDRDHRERDEGATGRANSTPYRSSECVTAQPRRRRASRRAERAVITLSCRTSAVPCRRVIPTIPSSRVRSKTESANVSSNTRSETPPPSSSSAARGGSSLGSPRPRRPQGRFASSAGTTSRGAAWSTVRPCTGSERWRAPTRSTRWPSCSRSRASSRSGARRCQARRPR